MSVRKGNPAEAWFSWSLVRKGKGFPQAW